MFLFEYIYYLVVKCYLCIQTQIYPIFGNSLFDKISETKYIRYSSKLLTTLLQVHDTPTLVHNNNNYLAPVKAELVTNELDEEETERLGGPRKQQQQQMPPPYHIAATKSKQASNFVNIHHRDNTSHQQSQEEHFYENQETVKRAGAVNGHHARPLERKSSFLSDGTFESISEVSL